ncbi:RNA polymerase sigma factor [Desulfitibacter alkalitolerans]|uniref:RNA polymerase sigma factor n=1 Tax=Desulfitibacter alkalitolerans TaxID=264641 RepID=UPI0004830E10|nr:RNA polymerase sigma factor [Desulfitibacter alkalitolerans]
MLSFIDIYRTHHKTIYRYFLYVTANTSLAEDLTQETFFQAFLSCGTFKEQSAPLTWLMAIARRVYLKHLRQDKKHLHLDTVQNSVCPSRENKPEHVWDNKELSREIIQVLQLLPESYRTVIILREIEECSFEEIGAVLEKSPASVRVILSRAKKRFRELYCQKI